MANETIRVAILGGGPSALAAAWELTNPEQNGAYDVTVHQLGWRLGGKCASGRNRGGHDQVQEHGLHVFFGYYDNAFEVLRAVYDERAKVADAKYKTIFDALVPSENMAIAEKAKAADGVDWSTWSFETPKMPGLPGEGAEPDLWHTLVQGLEYLYKEYEKLAHWVESNHGAAEPHDWLARFLGVHIAEIEGRIEASLGRAFREAKSFASDLLTSSKKRGSKHDLTMLSHLEDIRASVEALWEGDDFDSWWDGLENDLKRAFIIIDLGVTIIMGALRDGFFFDREDAVDRMNEKDLRDWLASHGARKATIESAPVRSIYDLNFAYPSGDSTKKGDLAAGSTIAGMMQMAQYHGPFMWRMRAGTGDVVAAPMYLALRDRGVKFEFFSKVTELIPSEFEDRIEGVKISKQVNLKNREYSPLFEIDDLACWPSEPDYDQIVEGEELKDRGINLESRWADWKDTGPTVQLTYGEDYDVVLLAIPIDGLHDICSRLAEEKRAWRSMLTNVKTVQTQSVQMSLKHTTAQLGPLPEGTVVGGNNASPLFAAADMSQVLEVESWPEDERPAHLSILAGVLPGPPTAPPPSDKDFVEASKKQVLGATEAFLEKGAATIWPEIAANGKVDWSNLWAPEGHVASPEKTYQYLRANIDPSERYTLVAAGSSKHRMTSDGSTYYNLYLAGDWTDNPGGVGDFESTIMSGRLASRAISGLPKRIARVPGGSRYYRMRQPYQSPKDAPLFVEHDGIQTYPGPFTFENVKAWSFFLEGDAKKLQAVCDRYFNKPSGGAVSVAPLSNIIMMSFIDVKDAKSPYLSQVSGAHEREVAFWMYLGKKRSAESSEITSIAGFTPFLVIDTPMGYTEGREVWGYQKQLGTVSLPDDGDPSFKVDAYGTRKRNENATWEYRNLLKMHPVGDANAGEPQEWEGFEEACKLIAGAFSGTELLIPTWKLAENLIDDVMQMQMHQIFLKQFRDIHDSQRACYQAITTAPVDIHSIKGVTIPQPHELVIDDLANTAVSETLGIGEKVNVPFGMHFTMSFTLNNGNVVWKA